MKKTLLSVAVLAATLFNASHAQTFANASFETWQNYNAGSLALEKPTGGWFGGDALVATLVPFAQAANIVITPQKQLFKSTVAHSGSFSAEARTAFIGSDAGNIPGMFSNANIELDFMSFILGGGNVDNLLNYVSYTGGTPVTAQVDTVKAWVQLDSATNLDQAVINVSAVKKMQGSGGADSTAIIGTGNVIIERRSSQFVQVAVPVTYLDAQIPDTLIVVFMSSNFAADTMHDGNALKVDDVSYSYKSGGTSIQQPLLSASKILVYPVPATTQIYFNLSPDVKPADFNLSVYDINGRLVSREQLKQAVNAKDVSGWAKGSYSYQLSNTQNGRTENGKFIVE